MRDADVRSALHRKVLREHHGQPDTLVLDELGLWYGTARVDVAVVNGRIHGYEIKSERDTLDRLPAQASVYSSVLDRVTLVVGESHASKACSIIPDWWGIKVAHSGPRQAVHFHEERAPAMNPAIDPVAVAALLWCEELTDILTTKNAIRGLRGKRRDLLTRRVAELLPLEDLRAVVRERLKARTSWRLTGAQSRPTGQQQP
ncbi:sce7726 family protein [Sorangium sp. So ce1000]|uniref:sce7726 family protein n=1 Tax=Sorangium sp. So ce1000 TaxID=3133325 RepID=UPI003F625394